MDLPIQAEEEWWGRVRIPRRERERERETTTHINMNKTKGKNNTNQTSKEIKSST